LYMEVIDLDSQSVTSLWSRHRSVRNTCHWNTACVKRVVSELLERETKYCRGWYADHPEWCQVKYVTAMTKHKVAASGYCCCVEYLSRQALQILLLLALVHYHWLVTLCTFLVHVCLHWETRNRELPERNSLLLFCFLLSNYLYYRMSLHIQILGTLWAASQNLSVVPFLPNIPRLLAKSMTQS
jgi:hypothetical protein